MYSKANKPKVNSINPMTMLLVAMRFRVHSLGPHRIARDISASSEKNMLIMMDE
jgi:hypothetical protein